MHKQQYALSQYKRAGIFDSRFSEGINTDEVTRCITYEMISVIPLCFKEEALALHPAERRWYEVKLPVWYVLKYRHDEDDITFCDVAYDTALGATLEYE
ncbi:MAG: hypothetical protein ACXV4B_07395 [Halobacteriota archaeon]